MNYLNQSNITQQNR